MDQNRPLFILVGNDTYLNRGCEAIVRGTTRIIRKYFDSPQFITISRFRDNKIFAQQRISENDHDITHLKNNIAYKRFTKIWFIEALLRRAAPSLIPILQYSNMLPFLKKATAILAVGGDNYSLDYGVPKFFTNLDDIAFKKKVPLFLWGASIGPFSKLPQYEKFMARHLSYANGIMARESRTIEYLNSIGISSNVFQVADPAFVMEPSQPAISLAINDETIGLNLSPLMAKYCCDGNFQMWIEKATILVDQLIEFLNKNILLVYHVTTYHTDDYSFLNSILQRSKHKGALKLLPPGLSAPELKWIIGKCCVFAGARTHSTIAALSSCVPTLSFAYSIKARGINKDIFNSTEFCLEPEQLNEKTVIGKIKDLLDRKEYIKLYLNKKMPAIIDKAYEAGWHISNLLNSKNDFSELLKNTTCGSTASLRSGFEATA